MNALHLATFVGSAALSFITGVIMSKTPRYQCYGINTDSELTAAIEYAVELFPYGANKDDLRNLLKETAIAESTYGSYIYDSKRGFGYGCFQFDPIGMKQAVQVATNKNAIGKIRALSLTLTPLSMDTWREVYNNELQLKVTLQAILCRFYYLGVAAPIPSTIEGRAAYWKKYYNSELGAGTPQAYMNRVAAFYKDKPYLA